MDNKQASKDFVLCLPEAMRINALLAGVQNQTVAMHAELIGALAAQRPQGRFPLLAAISAENLRSAQRVGYAALLTSH